MISTLKYKIMKFLGFKTEDEVEWEEDNAGQTQLEIRSTEQILEVLVAQIVWHRPYDGTYHPHKIIFSESEIKDFIRNACFEITSNQLRRV